MMGNICNLDLQKGELQEVKDQNQEQEQKLNMLKI